MKTITLSISDVSEVKKLFEDYLAIEDRRSRIIRGESVFDITNGGRVCDIAQNPISEELRMFGIIIKRNDK